MNWRPTALILVAFLAAAGVVWFTPALFAPLGLGEFVIVGQIVFAILVLSVLDAVFKRLPPTATDHAIGPAIPPPPDR